MKAALRGSYLDAVYFMGISERYPDWFCEELYDAIISNESNYTFWVDRFSRAPDYYEKQLVEDYSVFLRKETGEIFVTNYDVLYEMYTIFRTDSFENSALVAFNDDVIDYVECHGGHMLYGINDDWFYEFFTEAIHNPPSDESVFITVENGDITIKEHCAVMLNKFGEIRIMDWATFIKYYDPDPAI